ncbi:MAG: PmoA family protein [Marinoscillum sp.]
MIFSKTIVKLLSALIFTFTAITLCAQIEVDIERDSATFTENGQSILVYQISEKSMDNTYSRSNYIHPLYSLDDIVLTEDFPRDHLHHRGIFWAWHQLYIGEKRIGDGWEIEDFRWEVAEVKEIFTSEPSRTIQATVYWKSPLWQDKEGNEKPFVKEVTKITVQPIFDGERRITIEISLLALERNVSIGGSEDEKGYGGFSARINMPDDLVFTGQSGKVEPENLPVNSGPWIDMTGSIGGSGNRGVTIIAHPDNPGYPNPWILRSKGSMQNAVFPHPGRIPVNLSDSLPTILKYQLVIHDGSKNSVNYGQFR